MAEQSRVRVAGHLAGKFAIQPKVVIRGQVVEHLWRHFDAVVFTAKLDMVADLLAAPVFSRTRHASLTQVTRKGWERRLEHIDSALGDSPNPVLLSAQTNWVIHKGELQAFDSAFIVDGAARVEARIRAKNFGPVVFVAFLGMTDKDELLLREDLLGGHISSAMTQEQKVDTECPRFHVKTSWTHLTLESDPFVVPTARGYAPAMLVKRPSTPHREHLLIGAKSLALPLEELRASHGTLIGQRVRIRKVSDHATALYELEAMT